MDQPKENKNKAFREVSTKAVYLLTQKIHQSFCPCVHSCYHFALIHVCFRDFDAYSGWELSIELLQQDKKHSLSQVFSCLGFFLKYCQ